MVTRLLLIVLDLGLLSTLSERYDDPALDGTASYDRYDDRGSALGASQGELGKGGCERKMHEEEHEYSIKERRQVQEQERAYQQHEQKWEHAHDPRYAWQRERVTIERSS